jgi:hypothetical protein
MRHSWQEFDRMAAILEAELDGRVVDCAEARRLAARLAETCPNIALTMKRVAERMVRAQGA